MGCCMSRPDGRNSPYQGGAGESGSGRAINHPPRRRVVVSPAQHSINDSIPSPVSVEQQQHRSRRRHQHANQPLDQHLNRPLRRHEWMSGDRKWTPSALVGERRDFFDTRVTGRQEIWQAIHAALELMWEADTAARNSRVKQQQNEATVSEEDIQISATANASEQARQEALTLAQTILSAAEITIPTGDLANGVYDSFGNFYGLPEHIVADPIDVALTSNPTGYTDAKGELTAGEDTAEEEEADEDDKSVAQRREEKGKAVVDARDQIALKARLSEGDRDVNLSIGRGESVRSVARRIAEEAMLASNKNVRLAYMGTPQGRQVSGASTLLSVTPVNSRVVSGSSGLYSVTESSGSSSDIELRLRNAGMLSRSTSASSSRASSARSPADRLGTYPQQYYNRILRQPIEVDFGPNPPANLTNHIESPAVVAQRHNAMAMAREVAQNRLAGTWRQMG